MLIRVRLLLTAVFAVASAWFASAAAPERLWIAGGHFGWAPALGFTPAGEQFFTIGDRSVMFWNTNDWSFVREVPSSMRAVNHAALSPNGQLIALSYGYDVATLLLRVSDGALLHSFPSSNAVYRVAFSPDSQRLAIASDEGLHLHRVDNGELVSTLSADGTYVTDVSFSPDGTRITTATGSGLRVWSQDGRLIYAPLLEGSLYRVSYSPDGTRLAVSMDHVVQILHASNGAPVTTFTGHESFVQALAWSPDGTRILSADTTNAFIWNASNAAIDRVIAAEAPFYAALAFSPDGSQAFLSGLGGVEIFDAASGARVGEVGANHGAIADLGFSSDGRLVATANGRFDRRVRVWHASNGAPALTFEGHPSTTTTLAFSPDGTRIVSGGDDGVLRLWNSSNAALLHTWQAHTALVRTVQFAPAGHLFASAGSSPLVQIWNSDGSSNTILVSGAATNRTGRVRFSPDGAALAASGSDGTIRLWWTSNWTSAATLIGHERGVGPIDFSAAGDLLASGSSDRTVKIWRWRDAMLMHSLPQTGSVANVAFFADGKLLAVTSGGTIHFWHVSAGTYAGNLTDPAARSIRQLRFSPDSQSFAYARFDNTLIVARAPVVVHGMRRDGDEVVIDWFGPAGTYHAEGATALAPTAWLPVGEPFAQSPVRLNFTDAPTVFFRLRRDP